MELANFIATLGTPGEAIFAVAGLLSTAYLLGRLLIARMCLSSRVGFVAGGGVGGWQCNEFFLAITLGLDLVILIAMPCQWLGSLPDWLLRYLFGGSLIIVAYQLMRAGWASLRRKSSIPWHLTPFLAMALLLWQNALSYPYSFDDLTYQIAVPRRWMLANSLEVFGDNPFSAFPGVNLIGNLVLLKAGGLLAPLLFTYALGLILALAIHFLLRQRLAPWPATILTLSMVFSLSFLLVTTSAYAEPMILLQFVAILFLCERAGTWDWLLIGVFCGFAASVKLTGGIIALAMVGFFLFTAWRDNGRQGSLNDGRAGKPVLRAGLAFLGPMILVVLLFYSRSWLATGDPFYPYFAGVFTDPESTLAMSEYHHDAGKIINLGHKLDGPWQMVGYFFATPILLTVGPMLATNDYDGYFGLQCLIHAMLIGSLFWPWRGQKQSPGGRDPMLWVYLGCALLFYTFWFFTARQSRFLLPALLCMVMASSCARTLFTGRSGVIILALLLILTVASLPGRLLEQVVFGWKDLVAGNHRAVDYLDAAVRDKYLTACARIRDLTPINAKVMLIYEQRGLYVPRAYVIGTPYFQERFFTPPSEIASDDDLMGELHRAKVTHVLVAFESKDPDRMEKYVELRQPFQDRLERLILANRLKTRWPDVRKESVDFALYEVGP